MMFWIAVVVAFIALVVLNNFIRGGFNVNDMDGCERRKFLADREEAKNDKRPS